MLRTVGLSFAFLALFWSPGSKAQETRTDQYNLGIIGLAPYAYAAEDGTEIGYMVEIAAAIRKASRMTGFDEVLPLKRLHLNMNKGMVDCTILAKVPLSLEAYDMLVPIGKNVESVIVPRVGIDLSSYDDLKGLQIAVPNGVNLDKRFHNDASLSKFVTQGYLQTTKMLQRARVDAMIGIWDSYLFNMRKIGMSRDEIGRHLVLNKAPIWLMCGRGFQNESVKKRLIETVDDLRDKGLFMRIVAKYLGDID